jgi:hypothetical protein
MKQQLLKGAHRVRQSSLGSILNPLTGDNRPTTAACKRNSAHDPENLAAQSPQSAKK